MTSHALRIRKQFVARRERLDAAGRVAGAALVLSAFDRMRDIRRLIAGCLGRRYRRLPRCLGRGVCGLRRCRCRLMARLTRVVGAAIVIGRHRLEAALAVAGQTGLAAGQLMRDGRRAAGARSGCGRRGRRYRSGWRGLLSRGRRGLCRRSRRWLRGRFGGCRCSLPWLVARLALVAGTAGVIGRERLDPALSMAHHAVVTSLQGVRNGRRATRGGRLGRLNRCACFRR